MRKICVVIVLVVCCALLLGGCNSKMFETPDEDAFVENFLESIEQGDYTRYLNRFIENVRNDKTFPDFLVQLDDYYNGEIVDVKKTGVYFRTTTSGDSTRNTREVQYLVETTQSEYVVYLVSVSEGDELYEIAILNVTKASELKGNGAIIDFENLDIVQLLLIVFSVLCFAFIIFAIVLCAKSKVRLKGLWIPMIIIIQSGISITNFPSQHGFNIHIFATTMSMLRKFVNGGTILTVMVPLGAILFVALRKKLERRAIEYREVKELEKQAHGPEVVIEKLPKQDEEDF